MASGSNENAKVQLRNIAIGAVLEDTNEPSLVCSHCGAFVLISSLPTAPIQSMFHTIVCTGCGYEVIVPVTLE